MRFHVSRFGHLRRVGEQDIEAQLAAALPFLFQVSINGADSGDTLKMGWDRLIRPLGEGTYDVSRLVRHLRALGYRGPIGLQGYGIKGEPREHLLRSIRAWNVMKQSDAAVR